MKEFELKNIGLSEKQINEHLKLYQGYVKKSQDIREKFGNANWEDANTTQSEIRNLILGETFANNGVRLHEAYFENISEEQEPKGEAKKLIIEKFRSMEEFNKRLTSFALSVRGWVIFAWDFETKRFRLFGTDQHDLAVWNVMPLIVLDVYEHAYFIDFGTDKKAYINWFLKHINWKVISSRTNKIQKNGK